MYVSISIVLVGCITFGGVVSQRLASYLGSLLVKCFIAHWIPNPEDANIHEAFQHPSTHQSHRSRFTLWISNCMGCMATKLSPKLLQLDVLIPMSVY